MKKPSNMRRRFRVSILATASAFVLLTSTSMIAQASSSDDDVRAFKAVIQQHGDTSVPVKFVMTVSGMGTEQQQEGQTQGTLVSADGLILVPGRVVSLDLGAFSRGSGIGGTSGSSASAKSGQFRVRLPGNDEWLPADLVTRDTELGLAWLRLRHPGGKLPFVDFKDAAKVDVGTQLFTVMRTSDQFGSVPIVRAGYVLGETNVPRHAWLIDGSPGVAFDSEGKPAGFVDVDLAGMVRSRNASGSIGMDQGDAEFTMIPAERIGRVNAQAAVLPIVKPSDGDIDEPLPTPPVPEHKHGANTPEPAPTHPASPGDDQPKPDGAQPNAPSTKKSSGA